MEDKNKTPGELVPTEAIPMDQLIVVRQLPVIEEHLRHIKEQTVAKVTAALSLVCCEETLQSVKNARTELRKEFDNLEAQRKQVKAAVLAPYEQFEAVYKDCVSNQFKQADTALQQKIVAVESGMKEACENGLREYFAELCEANNLDFLRYEQACVKVDLTSARAKVPTKLRSQLEQFVVGVACDVRLIAKMDDAEEIMVEYKRSLSVAKAVAAVQERHHQVEAERAAAAQRQEAQEQEAKVVERVQSFAPPVAEEKPDLLRLTFSVTDTKPRLRLLKQFLDANGYKYE